MADEKKNTTAREVMLRLLVANAPDLQWVENGETWTAQLDLFRLLRLYADPEHMSWLIESMIMLSDKNATYWRARHAVRSVREALQPPHSEAEASDDEIRAGVVACCARALVYKNLATQVPPKERLQRVAALLFEELGDVHERFSDRLTVAQVKDLLRTCRANGANSLAEKLAAKVGWSWKLETIRKSPKRVKALG